MHELPTVTGLLDTLLSEARQNHIHKVTTVTIRIGELSDMVDECIQLYFDLAAEGTVCEGATLIFEHEPAQLYCPTCGREFPHTDSFTCPDCGAMGSLKRGTGSGCVLETFQGE